MRKRRLLLLLMLLTLTSVTMKATAMAELPNITQPQPKPKPRHDRKAPHKVKHHAAPPPKHHAAPPPKHHVAPPPPPKHHRRPAGVVIHHKHKPYIYSRGRYYCNRGGTYVLVKPSIGMIVPSLPTGYVIVKRPRGRIGYAFGGVVYEKITSNGVFKFKIVGFL